MIKFLIVTAIVVGLFRSIQAFNVLAKADAPIKETVTAALRFGFTNFKSFVFRS